MREQHRLVVEHHLDVTTEHICDCRGGTFVGDEKKVGSGLDPEKLPREMRIDPLRSAELECSRLALCLLDKLFHRVR